MTARAKQVGLIKQATHIQDRLDRIEIGKEAPTKVARTLARLQSWRGKLSKPKYGLQVNHNIVTGDFNHSYTRAEWDRLKKARKLARQTRRRS